jgi:nucleoside 2-deoxyribosyltransferase
MTVFEGKRVYLSGPMSAFGAEGDWNRESFDDAEEFCLRNGANGVYNPGNLAPFAGEEPLRNEQYMVRCINELSKNDWKCGEWFVPYYDIILMLPGFEDSDGAMVELAVAEACGIEVVVLEEMERGGR